MSVPDAEDFVDGTSVDTQKLVRTTVGGTLTTFVLIIIGFLESWRRGLIELVSGGVGFTAEIWAAIIGGNADAMRVAWMTATEDILGWGPLTFIAAVIVGGVALYAAYRTVDVFD